MLVGFLTGVGIQVAAGQLPGMLGITAVGLENASQALGHGTRSPAHTSGGCGDIDRGHPGRAGSKEDHPPIPGPLIAVIIAISVSYAANLASRGVAVVGPVPRGLPSLGLPAVGWHDATVLAGAAASMFVVILAQGAATSRAYAVKYEEEEYSADTDLVGLGAANVAAAFSGTFVVNGARPRRRWFDSAGGRSQLAQLTTAAEWS